MSSKTRIWVLLTVVVCIVVLVLGVAGGLLPQFAAAGGTLGLAADSEQRNELSRAQIDMLKQREGRLDELSSELEELRRAIPDTAASADWVRELARIEQESGARVIAFSLATPAVGDESTAPAEDAETGAEEETDAGAGAAAAAPVVEATGGILVVPIELAISGDENQVTEFVRLLQTGERLVLVRMLTQRSTGDTWEADISGDFYVLQR